MSGAGVDRNGKQETATIKVTRDTIAFLYFGVKGRGKRFSTHLLLTICLKF